MAATRSRSSSLGFLKRFAVVVLVQVEVEERIYERLSWS